MAGDASNLNLILRGVGQVGQAAQEYGKQQEVEKERARKETELNTELPPPIQAILNRALNGEISAKQAGIEAKIAMQGSGIGAPGEAAPQQAPHYLSNAPSSQTPQGLASEAPYQNQMGLASPAPQVPPPSMAQQAPQPPPQQSLGAAPAPEAAPYKWRNRDMPAVEMAGQFVNRTQPKGLSVEDRMKILEKQGEVKGNNAAALQTQKDEAAMSRKEKGFAAAKDLRESIENGLNTRGENVILYNKMRDTQRFFLETRKLEARIKDGEEGRLSKEQIADLNADVRVVAAQIAAQGRVESGYGASNSNPDVLGFISDGERDLDQMLIRLYGRLGQMKPKKEQKQQGATPGAPGAPAPAPQQGQNSAQDMLRKLRGG